jgi:P4 family phage/plasmid primase-like protien
MKYYLTKSTAQDKIKKNELLCNYDIKKYFIVDDYIEFLKIIKKNNMPENNMLPCFYEFISENSPVPFYFDIEIYKEKQNEEYNNHINVIEIIKQKIIKFKNILKNNDIEHNEDIKFIILEAHSELKRSYHIKVLNYVLFENVKILKQQVNELFKDTNLITSKILDTSVYREGLFRTLYSTKSGENRPFVKSNLSDDFDEIESFICYFTEDNLKLPKISKMLNNESNGDTLEFNIDINDKDDLIYVEPIQKELTQSNKNVIKMFIKKHYNYNNYTIRDIIIDHQHNCIVVALDDKYCHNVDKEHRSNNQYIVIDTLSSKRKCHDVDCQKYKYNEIKMADYSKELNEIIKNVLKINKKELELIDKAIKECKDYITEYFDESLEQMEFDKNNMVFKGNASIHGSVCKINGKCRECQTEHQISNTGYCLKCIVCKSQFPKMIIPIDDKYKHLNNFWTNYSQLNNCTINITNNNTFNNTEEEFNCDVQLDSTIFNNNEITALCNQILDGHKVTKISELISKLEIDFKYTNSEWYFFNTSIWKRDKESLELRKKISNLSQHFNKIKLHYEKTNNDAIKNNILVKNIKSLITKLYKPGFEDDIIKGAKRYYDDEYFINKLNSKKYLIPFTNGVFDLLKNEFRMTNKDDYVNLTVNYHYDQNVNNQEVHKFLKEVLPDSNDRDYVLKRMSDCLNGDYDNTYLLMFTGHTGANGKSQLLNLMKLTMGDFGEKVEVTLLTRKRNNANEANSEKIKLMGKRFAFLSEPDDGDKINGGLLKEFTSTEPIVARGLYQESVSFVMQAKLFFACNELPEIKGEDTALWRRLRVVNFPSRFVEEPTKIGEYKIDRSIPSKMNSDITWRQTFLNILIEYYYKDVKEPDSVKLKTNEYREENNEFFTWMDEHVEYKENEILQLSDVCEMYLCKKVGSRVMSKYRKEIEKYIQEKYENVNFLYQNTHFDDRKYRGWLHFNLKDDY